MLELKCTNFLGLDHVISGEAQLGENNTFELYSGRYLMPITPRLDLGGSYIRMDQELKGDVEILEIKGTGDIANIYMSYKLIEGDNFSMSVSPGFDYKDIENKVLGAVYSEDKMRIAKLGLDFDINDPLGGRSIIAQEFDCGIEDILGGLKAKDPIASRAGTGGRFYRSVTNAARIQSLPGDLALMLKGSMQLTSYSLVSTEQFNIGGFTSVRGYPVAEYSGDKGYTASAELYIPPFIIPKSIKVPFTDTTFYDAIRFVGFADWGRVETRDPALGEAEDESIYSAGPAIRFEIPQRLSVSCDYGFQLGQDANDGSESRFYVEAKLYF